VLLFAMLGIKPTSDVYSQSQTIYLKRLRWQILLYPSRNSHATRGERTSNKILYSDKNDTKSFLHFAL
jgi:hypothetical protein